MMDILINILALLIGNSISHVWVEDDEIDAVLLQNPYTRSCARVLSKESHPPTWLCHAKLMKSLNILFSILVHRHEPQLTNIFLARILIFGKKIAESFLCRTLLGIYNSMKNFLSSERQADNIPKIEYYRNCAIHAKFEADSARDSFHLLFHRICQLSSGKQKEFQIIMKQYSTTWDKFILRMKKEVPTIPIENPVPIEIFEKWMSLSDATDARELLLARDKHFCDRFADVATFLNEQEEIFHEVVVTSEHASTSQLAQMGTTMATKQTISTAAGHTEFGAAEEYLELQMSSDEEFAGERV